MVLFPHEYAPEIASYRVTRGEYFFILACIRFVFRWTASVARKFASEIEFAILSDRAVTSSKGDSATLSSRGPSTVSLCSGSGAYNAPFFEPTVGRFSLARFLQPRISLSPGTPGPSEYLLSSMDSFARDTGSAKYSGLRHANCSSKGTDLMRKMAARNSGECRWFPAYRDRRAFALRERGA